MAHKVKALQQWCKLRCDGYRDVEITNMTSSWKSGLAFCAIIHRYRPDLVDYDSLKKEDTYGNSKRAFDVALHELGIAALLDPEDMEVMAVPDKLCIVTYVAQYYNYFHDKPQLGGPGVKAAATGLKRSSRMLDVFPPPEAKKLPEITNTISSVAPPVKPDSPAAKRRTIEDRCCMCHEKVYLLERHYSGGKLYHRHCCREAERTSTLKRSNYGTPSVGKENSGGGDLPKGEVSKTRPAFGSDTSTQKVEKPVSKSSSVIKSLFVPNKYKPEISEPPPEPSKIPTTSIYQSSSPFQGPTTGNKYVNSGPPQTKNVFSPSGGYTPKTVTVTTLGNVAKLSPSVSTTSSATKTVTVTASGYVAKLSPTVSTTSSATNTVRTSVLVAPSPSNSKSLTVGAPKILTPTVSTTSSAANTVRTNILVGVSPSNLNSLTVDTSKHLTTTTPSPGIATNSSSNFFGNRTLSTPTSKPSNNATSYTSVFGSRAVTGGTVTSVTSPVASSGFTSNLTTTVPSSYAPQNTRATDVAWITPSAGQVPSYQLGTGDIKFTFKYGDGVTTPAAASSGPGNALTNKSVGTVLPISKSPAPFSLSDKGTTERPKSGVAESTSAKTEWQLEAEKRQAARNGTYVDPEKHPQSAAGRRSTGETAPPGQVEKIKNGEQKENDTKKGGTSSAKDTSKDDARGNLVQILHRQLHKKETSKTPAAVVVPQLPPQAEEAKPPTRSGIPKTNEESWVIVERPGSEFSEEFSPLSPPEKWKRIVDEGTVGFTNTDRVTDIAQPCFDPSPRVFPKQKQVKENPLIPKRKVNAEKKISVDEINKKLVALDQQLRVVEAKGRGLEDKIRGGTDEAMDADDDEVMIDWFSLVKQKYDLVRDESDLMYRRRQQELEEHHEELEYQYRCLSSKPDDEKTFSDKKYEEELLKDLLEIVKLRDNIVNSIEVDRQRYLEEDQKIENMMEATGLNSTGKGRKKRKKNKNRSKSQPFVEKDGGIQRRISWFKKSPKTPATE